MNQNFTTEIKDTKCSSCHCEDQKFLHRVWDGGEEHKICTSCVLFSNRKSFCSTCFALHDFNLGEKLVICQKCYSKSHTICFSHNGHPLGAPPICSTCMNPHRMIFILKNLKEGGVHVKYKGIDEHAVELLLTAATLVKKSISEKRVPSEENAWKLVEDAVEAKKDAKADVTTIMNRSRETLTSH